MLQSLYIQNYALINELEIDFNSGLNIITGETGAGKSILLGALSLILGQRADTTILKDKSKKCFVEAKFKISKFEIKDFFKTNDIDYDDVSVIRREITDNGKSRAFINDTPVNISILKELGAFLVDIHSQHQTLLLGDDHFQLSLVDSFVNHKEILEKYGLEYNEYNKLVSEYNGLLTNSKKAKDDLDYYQFQYNQLDTAKLIDGEQEELEAELEKLTHSEEIKLNLSNSYNILNGEEIDLLSNLKQAKNSIISISNYMKDSSTLANRLESAYIELNDIAKEIENLNDSIEHDPERIVFIKEKLDIIYSLQQKHKCNSVSELIKIKNDLSDKIELITSYDFRIDDIVKQINREKEVLEKLSVQISGNRKKRIPDIEKKIADMLHQLGIPNAVFNVEQIPSGDYLPTGKETIVFLFSANKNVVPEELSKVASGGEMSRLMLSLKSIMAESLTLPTIIFDEIDAGTSGEIADKMGAIVKRMSEKMQVIHITHLPQIAVKGNYHYLVYKKDNTETTNTHIKLLNKEERVNEIAKMLSGESLTDAAIQNAKVLLGEE
ncbi:MAG: DNA repair protein RecN [Bacteroidetes bacterium GWC2_33_15]|nr:MAG: DNA repair protein RecN [Bacteroidetes bacterium GWA2_33_15]OFX52128.1 MAG: DNA repair protein RecN [Bacteroidetes bacterium GWC2_33_15]OFX64282.1 MAG: DNA repair protein RecN [Bacteroidetes bacterium GWB2_32_14]OFX67687.1 MAG: DNA repair protein RecN [Bacteroidetes bacterium GWD2_33_33]HAN19295.1 DNA repair protein RecN [Bacteroidales bacterium]